MLNVLLEPVIRTGLTGGRTMALPLPEVYAALMEDRVTEFPAVRRHEQHAWHAFLCQLGAIATRRSGRDDPPRNAAAWRRSLERLTGGPESTAWHLVEPDESQPALLQPGTPEGARPLRRRIDCADDLDVLVTAANHDVKQSIARHAQADDWLAALVTVQTTGRYQGNGKRNVVRMNRGYGSRPGLGLAPAEGEIGAHVESDIRGMLRHRDAILNAHPEKYAADGGIELLWTEPWDGETSIPLGGGHLDPYFIEVCRRVRLQVAAGGGLRAHDGSTPASRIDGAAACGNTGDFWTPTDAKRRTALTLPPEGFTYRRLAELLFDEERWELPGAMRAAAGGRGSWRVVARCLAGGQGKTGGYHERIGITFSPETARALGDTTERRALAEIAKRRVQEAARVELALGSAAMTRMGKRRGEDANRDHRTFAARAVSHLEAAMTPWLFESIDEEYRAGTDAARAAARVRFGRRAIERARRLLGDGACMGAAGGNRRYRLESDARSTFEGVLRGPKGPFRTGDGIVDGGQEDARDTRTEP